MHKRRWIAKTAANNFPISLITTLGMRAMVAKFQHITLRAVMGITK